MFKKSIMPLIRCQIFQFNLSADSTPPRCYIINASITIPSKPGNFNLFIENSFILDDYISGYTGFKNDLSRVMIHAKEFVDEGKITDTKATPSYRKRNTSIKRSVNAIYYIGNIFESCYAIQEVSPKVRQK